jgi:hypothetical protein
VGNVTRAALALALAALLAAPARAVLPDARRVAGAVASANRADRRTAALELGVELVRDGSEVVGRGTLQLHPSGPARLELRGAGGLLERHLLLGGRHSASRNGALLGSPPPFLPPLQLLQASSGAALEGVLAQLGASGEIALGRTRESDCYVLGGREPGADRAPPRRAALWVDATSFEVARIDRADGVRFELGPPNAFGDIRFPAWIGVEAPGQPELRLVVRSAARSAVDPKEFRREWLGPPAASRPPGVSAGPDGQEAGAGGNH